MQGADNALLCRQMRYFISSTLVAAASLVASGALASPSTASPNSSPNKSASLPAGAQAFVDAHNRVRAQHCAKPLAWSDKLAQIAQRWANALRDKGCAFAHSNGSTGENLAAGTSGTLDPEAVVKMWYDEV